MTRQDERTWAIAAHLSAYTGYLTAVGFVLGPLVVWLISRERSDFAARNAKEALNFNLSILLYAIVTAIACFLLVGLLVAWIVFPVLAVLQFVLPIFAAIKAGEGTAWRYPLTLRFVS